MNLSQDEINAMLSGKDAMPGAEETVEDDNITYTENDESSSAAVGNGNESVPSSDNVFSEYKLNEDEEDTLGEVGNMCMGAVATTMYTLLDRRVSITTPRVSVHTTKDVLADYSIPFVIVEVQYIEGIEGKNLLLLKEPDAALITDLLMGGEGVVEEPVVLNEMHMSAISEIMNQMIGASATTLSKLLHTNVNISPPKSDRVEIDADLSELLDYSQVVVKISFDMVIEGLLESQLIQLIPYKLACQLANKLMDAYGQEENMEDNMSNQNTPSTVSATESTAQQPSLPDGANPDVTNPEPLQPNKEQSPTATSTPSFTRHESVPSATGGLVDVHPMQFESFDDSQKAEPMKKGLDMIYDIPLQVSVELGKTSKDISEILEFGMGTVIVLEKIAGDPVEILANGKLIARGEVVVIDENYGVRITELFNN